MVSVNEALAETLCTKNRSCLWNTVAGEKGVGLQAGKSN